MFTYRFAEAMGVERFAYDPPSDTAINMYLDGGSGPLAQFGPTLTAFIKDEVVSGPLDDRIFDVEVFVGPTDTANELRVYFALMRPSCSSGNLHIVDSEGTVTIDESSIFLGCEQDKEVMSRSVELVTEALARVGSTPVADAEKSMWLYGQRTSHMNHWAGSCALGTCADAATLRVHGTENVAVVDASLLPQQVWGHPALTLKAMALKAADIIHAALRRLNFRIPPRQDQSAAPKPGSMAEVTVSVPVTMSGNGSKMERDGHLMATLRTVGQEVLGLHETEKHLVKVTMLQTDATPVRLSFVVSIPAERAAIMRVKTATEVMQIFQSSALSNHPVAINTATGEFVEHHLSLNDVRHHVVASIVDMLPASAFESTLRPRQESTTVQGTLAAPSLTEPPTQTSIQTTAQESTTLRGTLAARSSTKLPTQASIQTTAVADVDVEASDALGPKAFVAIIVAIVCAVD